MILAHFKLILKQFYLTRVTLNDKFNRKIELTEGFFKFHPLYYPWTLTCLQYILWDDVDNNGGINGALLHVPLSKDNHRLRRKLSENRR